MCSDSGRVHLLRGIVERSQQSGTIGDRDREIRVLDDAEWLYAGDRLGECNAHTLSTVAGKGDAPVGQ